jgi:hypothetical protein
MLGSADEVQEFTCQELLFLRGKQKEEKKDEEKGKRGGKKNYWTFTHFSRWPSSFFIRL